MLIRQRRQATNALLTQHMCTHNMCVCMCVHAPQLDEENTQPYAYEISFPTDKTGCQLSNCQLGKAHPMGSIKM